VPRLEQVNDLVAARSEQLGDQAPVALPPERLFTVMPGSVGVSTDAAVACPA
jgi:hypothetical protein